MLYLQIRLENQIVKVAIKYLIIIEAKMSPLTYE